MSRFSGPQKSGASRQLHNQRRTEAETRQAKERAWLQEHMRKVERDVANAKPLTDVELAEVMFALIAADAARTLYLLTGRNPVKE